MVREMGSAWADEGGPVEMVEEKELSEDCEEEEGGSSSSFCLKRARHAELIFGRMPEMVMAVMAQSLSP